MTLPKHALRISLALALAALAVRAEDKPKPPAESENEPGWAFAPLKRPDVPALSNHPVDAFLLQKLSAQGLRQSPEADRRTLIRRLTVDLTGLLPTPAEIEAFQKDASPDAYGKLVDRLLASPRYGERWARHWLDVAHYADSHGQDEDGPRPNAWPYRDYLIQSFNADKPYARFVKEQIAGDVLFPGDPDALVATGFLAAGPWDQSGLAGIREDSLDRLIAYYLDRDDMVASTMSTFTGLTAGCARCHDHKFDPITQEDYYSLQAVFAGVDKTERAYDADPAHGRKRVELAKALAKARAGKDKFDPALLSAENQALAAKFEADWRIAQKRWNVPETLSMKANGTTLKPLRDGSLLAVGKRPDKDTYTISLAADIVGMTGLRVEVLGDETLPHGGPGRADNGNLHLTEVRLNARPRGTTGPGTPIKLKAAAADFDQNGWGIAKAIDGDPATAWGIFPAVGQAHRAIFAFDKPVDFIDGTELIVELDQLHGSGHLIGRVRLAVTTEEEPLKAVSPILPASLVEALEAKSAWRTDAQKAAIAGHALERHLTRELEMFPPPLKVYTATNQVKAKDGKVVTLAPRPVHVLKRGEVTRPGEPAVAGSIAAVAGLPGRFKLADANDEGQRRAALAEWLAHKNNPLTWRVIVNRAWHYHFGRGIVDTPNDFGKMGGAPSHPELLDWLAVEFRDGGGSLKKLHRLLVTSAAYRQAVRRDPAASMKDADNRLLWRMNRTRLDAETVRDSILLLSGRLDDTMYGPPVRHFIATPGVHVTPDADYDKYDLDAKEARRRSVYRFVFRTRPDPLLEALDCPDASQSAPARSASVGALQALALWNNKFTLRHSEHLTDLAGKASDDLPDQIRFLCRQLLGRAADDAEVKEWVEYAKRHGLPNLCRVLLNGSEFLFID